MNASRFVRAFSNLDRADSCHPCKLSIIVEHVYMTWLEGIRSLRSFN